MNLNKISLISMVVAVSCTTTKQPAKTSEWVDLKEVGAAACTPWPMGEKDLEVQAVMPVKGTGKFFGFAGSVRQRNSSIEHVFIPANSSVDLDKDNAQILPLGSGAMIAAAWQNTSGAMIVVAHNSGSRSTLELRKASDNRVITRSTFVLDGNVREGDLAIDGTNVWLTLKTGDASTVFAKLVVKGKTAQFENIPFSSQNRGATLIVDQESHNAYVVENVPVGDKISFKITPLRSKDNAAGNPYSITMDAKGGVESWAVTGTRGGFYFAAITGDSMVGQGYLHSGMVVLRKDSATWGWKRELGFPDVHVSEPVWIASSSGPILTIMKWLDGEATMAVARATSKGLDIQKDRGVHAKGSIVVNGFEPSEGRLSTVVRHKNEERWQYSLCKSSL